MFDYVEIVDDRVTIPPPPDREIRYCVTCQHWRDNWPSFDSRQAAMAHLYERHFNTDRKTADVQRYIVPAKHLNEVVICMEACRLMITVVLHFGAAIKLIDEIREGVAGSSKTSLPYKLTKSMVRAFQQVLCIMIDAVNVTKAAKRKFAKTKSTTHWMQLHLGPGIDLLALHGTTLEFTFSAARNDLIKQCHADEYSTANSYEVVDAPYVLLSLLAGLTSRIDSGNSQSLLRTYTDISDHLVSARLPSKQLLESD